MFYQRPVLCEMPLPLWARGNCMLDVHMVAAGIPDGAKGNSVTEEIPEVKVSSVQSAETADSTPAVAAQTRAPAPEQRIDLVKKEEVAAPGTAVENDRKKKRREILLRRKAHFKKILDAAKDGARRASAENGATAGSGAGTGGVLPRSGRGLRGVAGGNGGADIINVQAGIRDGSIVSFVSPAYPIYARRKGHEGDVIVEGVIVENGLVRDCRLVRSSGHEELDRAALEAMLRARFNPARIAGFAVRKTVRLPFSFRLYEGRETALADSRAE